MKIPRIPRIPREIIKLRVNGLSLNEFWAHAESAELAEGHLLPLVPAVRRETVDALKVIYHALDAIHQVIRVEVYQ